MNHSVTSIMECQPAVLKVAQLEDFFVKTTSGGGLCR